jgi:hypothetical protein
MARPATLTDTEVTIVPKKEFHTFTVEEYKEYSEANGTYMGRKPEQKTKLTTQELRVLINENWTPKEVKDKHGLDDEELKSVVYQLSKEEQRDKPIKFGKV